MRNRNAPYFTGELKQIAADLTVLIKELKDTIKHEYIPFALDKELLNAQLAAAQSLKSIVNTRIKLRQQHLQRNTHKRHPQ